MQPKSRANTLVLGSSSRHVLLCRALYLDSSFFYYHSNNLEDLTKNNIQFFITSILSLVLEPNGNQSINQFKIDNIKSYSKITSVSSTLFEHDFQFFVKGNQQDRFSQLSSAEVSSKLQVGIVSFFVAYMLLCPKRNLSASPPPLQFIQNSYSPT